MMRLNCIYNELIQQNWKKIFYLKIPSLSSIFLDKQWNILLSRNEKKIKSASETSIQNYSSCEFVLRYNNLFYWQKLFSSSLQSQKGLLLKQF